MKKTITAYDAKREFIEYDRDYYTIEGLETIIDFYDEIDEDAEFDAIEICCDCTEYGNGAAMGYDDFITDYEYLYPLEEYAADYLEEGEEIDEDDYLDKLITKVAENTTVLAVPNDNIVVFAF